MKLENNFVDLEKRIAEQKAREREYLNSLAECAQATFKFEPGRKFIEFLIVESRMFAPALHIISNLAEKYKISSDYYAGQSDFGKKIINLLTEDMVAQLLKQINNPKKEGNNG